MSDLQVVRVSDVPVALRIGLSAAERETAQTVLVSVQVELAAPAPFALGDDLAGAVDYDDILRFLAHDLPTRTPVRLLETLADLIAAHALGLSPQIREATVEVKKPSVLKSIGGMASVSVRRRRGAAAANQEQTP